MLLPTTARRFICTLLVALAVPARGQVDPGVDALPSLASLEAAGAVIGEIRITTLDIFDLDDPRENNWAFRAANWLHIQTRPDTIRRQLLFASGERLSVRIIEETKRLLRGKSYLYEADIRPIAWRDGVVDLEVRTRDTWSLQPGASVKYAGGTSSGSVSLTDQNFLGTGMSFGIARQSRSEVSTAGGTRSNIDLSFAYPYAFDGHTTLAYSQSSFDAGSTRAYTVDRPFYALDSRWAAGLSSTRDDRVVSTYDAGAVAGQYRRRNERVRTRLGGSPGLVGGWVHRVSGGLHFEEDVYSPEPGLVAPAQLPVDRTLVAPFVHYEVVQEDFREVQNLDQIGRPEYLALGWHLNLEFGRAARGLGSTDSVSRYAASVGKGVRVAADGTLITAASVAGEYADGHTDRGLLSASARYYQRRGSRTVLYVSLAADATRFADATQFLSLGGETGLRGYPTNYQLGAQRVLFTVERRFYSDWYPLRLIRVGGAVFYDVGRAWGGPYETAASRHWPANVGFGLRLLSARSSSASTLHLDVAFPLEREAGVKRAQFSLQSKTGF